MRKQTRRFTWICWAVLEFSLCWKEKCLGARIFWLGKCVEKIEWKERAQRQGRKQESIQGIMIWALFIECTVCISAFSNVYVDYLCFLASFNSLHQHYMLPTPLSLLECQKNRSILTSIHCAYNFQGQLNLLCIYVKIWCTKFKRGTILEQAQNNASHVLYTLSHVW